MEIREKDFYIKKENGCYVLYVLRNKKELGKLPKEIYKVEGYYTELKNAFKKLLKYRMNKKYTGGQSYKDLSYYINLYLFNLNKLKDHIYFVYTPIYLVKSNLKSYLIKQK